ncbi:hypothetical protein J2X63_002839 [Agromyces sp. 3263]|uniref:hypothetical protein n=1 Tax=Agromyces sp. 3263 TaxID=2817750 RepID=UPI00285DAD0D|nr:hypothetical protein [Agromyces sp. 3263]MDR6907131.1 hypothetical protein [Agromyces sp. 3263]
MRGTIDVEAVLPQSVPFGAHELRFTTVGADGADVSTSIWFSVDQRVASSRSRRKARWPSPLLRSRRPRRRPQ